MFWEATGEIIPLAFGVIVTPMLMVAVIALLLGPKGKVRAFGFTIAFAAATFALTLFFASGTKSMASSDSFVVMLLHTIVGFAFAGLFFILAWRSWNDRPGSEEDVRAPKWLTAIDSFGAAKAAALGLLLAVANIKNVPVIIAAGSSIGTAQLGWPLVLITVLVFTGIASLGLLTATLVGSSGDAKVSAFLKSAKLVLTAHNSLILTIAFIMLGAVQLGKAVGSF